MVSLTVPASASKTLSQDESTVAEQYCTNLRAPVAITHATAPQGPVHGVEWDRVMRGDPVQINPSDGAGFKVMTVKEWSARWVRNEDFPDCAACGSLNTKEHHFVQTWCRGKKKWTSECVCLDCHQFTLREYADPDYLTPEDHMKQLWANIMSSRE